MDESATESRKDKSHWGLEGSHINRNGLPPGSLAPAFRLPRLDGGELALDDYRGQRVLLAFSDPNCGPCNQLAPELERLHRRSSDLQVLMVSRGDLETNRVKLSQHQLTFPVVLQHGWEISRKYEIFATPIAYLIDERGIIITDVAVGGDAILALIKEEGEVMRDRLQTRLGELKKEFETGQTRLQELQKQQMYLRETMLQISGAIQVLEELLADGGSVERNGTHAGEKQPLSSQMNPGGIMDPALQTPGLGGHDQGSRQNNPAVNMLGEKE